jgi:hypothetical protein
MTKGKEKEPYFPLKPLTDGAKEEIIRNRPVKIAPSPPDMSPAAGIDMEIRKAEERLRLTNKKFYRP